MDDDQSTRGVDDDGIRTLAEEYLQTHTHLPFNPDLKRTIKAEMRKWEERRETLSEDDPLYEASERAYEKNKQRWLRILDEENGERERFLGLIAENFVADGVWLEPQVMRAVNLVLDREYRDWLVVDGVRLDSDTDLSDEQKAELSMAVRELASRELPDSEAGDPSE